MNGKGECALFPKIDCSENSKDRHFLPIWSFASACFPAEISVTGTLNSSGARRFRSV